MLIDAQVNMFEPSFRSDRRVGLPDRLDTLVGRSRAADGPTRQSEVKAIVPAAARSAAHGISHGRNARSFGAIHDSSGGRKESSIRLAAWNGYSQMSWDRT
jgi:hypothetical protein